MNRKRNSRHNTLILPLVGIALSLLTIAPAARAEGNPMSLEGAAYPSPGQDDKTIPEVHEWASLSCPHCAEFQTTEFPKIAEKWIKTGKIRWRITLIPQDRTSAVATYAISGLSGQDLFNTIDKLYQTQKERLTASDMSYVLINIYNAAHQANTMSPDVMIRAKTVLAPTLSQPIMAHQNALISQATSPPYSISQFPTLTINGISHPIKSGEDAENFIESQIDKRKE